jgi:hypothetical protein
MGGTTGRLELGMKSPFGQVMILAKRENIFLPIIHSNDNDVTVLNAFTPGKTTWKTIPFSELKEIEESQYNRFNKVPYCKPTYLFTGDYHKIISELS